MMTLFLILTTTEKLTVIARALLRLKRERKTFHPRATFLNKYQTWARKTVIAFLYFNDILNIFLDLNNSVKFHLVSKKFFFERSKNLRNSNNKKIVISLFGMTLIAKF